MGEREICEMVSEFGGMMEWARQRGEEYLELGKTLSADGRGDEANLMRVRSNICGVFCALIGAVLKREKSDDELKELVKKTSAPWMHRLALAQSHGDAVTVAIEQAKPETLALLLGEWERRIGGGQL